MAEILDGAGRGIRQQMTVGEDILISEPGGRWRGVTAEGAVHRQKQMLCAQRVLLEQARIHGAVVQNQIDGTGSQGIFQIGDIALCHLHLHPGIQLLKCVDQPGQNIGCQHIVCPHKQIAGTQTPHIAQILLKAVFQLLDAFKKGDVLHAVLG